MLLQKLKIDDPALWLAERVSQLWVAPAWSLGFKIEYGVPGLRLWV